MPAPDPETLIQDYRLTTLVIQRLADGLTHAESLAQPSFKANCFNWVLGHIILHRDLALAWLGRAPLWPREVTAIYATGSAPLAADGRARALPDLLRDVQQSYEALVTALRQATPEQLNTLHGEGDERATAGEMIAGLHWHETYHTGQLELLREVSLAGRG